MKKAYINRKSILNMFEVILYSICMIKAVPKHKTFLAVRTYCIENTITIRNMPNSKIKTTVLNSYHDFKIEREKRWVTDLEREMNVDKDEEYKTKDQS